MLKQSQKYQSQNILKALMKPQKKDRIFIKKARVMGSKYTYKTETFIEDIGKQQLDVFNSVKSCNIANYVVSRSVSDMD